MIAINSNKWPNIFAHSLNHKKKKFQKKKKIQPIQNICGGFSIAPPEINFCQSSVIDSPAAEPSEQFILPVCQSL